MLLESTNESELVDCSEDSSRYSNSNSLAELRNVQSLRLKIRIKLVVSLVVRVAYAMTILVSNSGDNTTTSHNTSLYKILARVRGYISLKILSKTPRRVAF